MKRLVGRRARAAVAFLAITAAVGGALVKGLAAHASTSALRITVTEREYKLTLSRRAFKPGTVTFLVKNQGHIAHSLSIKGPGVAKRISGTIPPGASRTLVVKLKSGKYTLWCPVTGHAALGMKTTVSSSSAGTSSGGSGGGTWG
jgi:plastocyanin